MDSEELVATLEDAGLSPYQATAYVTLLDLGTASATELAAASDVPKPRIYDVLDALESRGFVETYQNDSLRASAHSPDEVLSTLRGRAERLDAAAQEVEERWEQPELEGNHATIVREFGIVLKRAEEFISSATNQIQLSVTPTHFERLRPALMNAHDRGVSIRLSIHTDPAGEPPALDRLRGACTEARHRGLPAPFVALVDRHQTCFAHHPDSYDLYGVVVDDRTHTYVFHWYFMTSLWEHCDPLYAEPTGEPPVKYVDIRYCVRDVRGLLDEGATVEVGVEGFDITSSDPVSFDGRVTGTRFTPGSASDGVLQLAGQVTLLVETDGREVSVGGWGAIVEEVEATTITVERVIRSSGGPDA
ncbi:TrmB family transcriptional regulator [Halomarina oriensis]|uniref:TrmB family transcriptional regulator n=1 Tax=Halomarina oriensis TaxID=671145 RepID=A0A6B0GRK2_9EURY|nr:TrmB family transcriptional regulator [Halomarina oriensis]MWG36269.1 TrmB family transcriptional regulator [Halomarina oriensis]